MKNKKIKCTKDICKNICTAENCKDRMSEYISGTKYIDGYGLCEDLGNGNYRSGSGKII